MFVNLCIYILYTQNTILMDIQVLTNAILILITVCLLAVLFYRVSNPPWPVEGMDGSSPLTSWPLNIKFSIDEQNELQRLVEPPPPPPPPPKDPVSMFLKENEQNKQVEYNKISDLPLRELTIKGAYNSAYDGTKFTLDQLGTIMINGSRFLDLQLFSANDGAIYVFHSDTPRAPITDTSLPFAEVLKYISQYAFSYDNKLKAKISAAKEAEDEKNGNLREKEIKPGAPIQETYIQFPLFIHLRINRSEKSQKDIVESIYTKYLNPESKTPILPISYFYRENNMAKPIDMTTQLKELKQKVIFMMDIDNIIQNYTTSFNADDVPVSVRSHMRKFVNTFTGGHTWKSFSDYDTISASPPIPLYAMDNGFRTNSDNLYIAYPGIKNSRNPDALKFISDYRIQLSPNRHYIQDSNLQKYEKFFGDMKKPFVPLAHAIKYNNGIMASAPATKIDKRI